MFIDFLIDVFRANENKDALVWRDKVYNYKWLLDRVYYWQGIIRSRDIKEGTVSILEADFSPNSVALFLALTAHGCILVPLTGSVEAQKPEFIKIAQGEVSFTIDENDNVKIVKLENTANHQLYHKLTTEKRPGLVLFTSGSTGQSKAVVHDLIKIMEKYKLGRHSFRTITFLLYDHIGGLNTMFYTLSNAGCIITVQNHDPDSVLDVVEKYKAELLPTSPSFINLILLNKAYMRHNLDSLKILTYGTEPMLETTLEHFHRLFPGIQLLQTYGLSEVGILRSKSKSSDSLWVKLGGREFQTRVVNGILQVKTQSAMLGYLNAPSPVTSDGWFDTGDRVEVEGEYMKILGRKSEIINVGGKKVFPVEVESVIHEIDNVAEATVYGERNPIIGNIVCAKVRLQKEEDLKEFSARLKKHCAGRLERFKVPVKVDIVEGKQHSKRFKKIRV